MGQYMCCLVSRRQRHHHEVYITEVGSSFPTPDPAEATPPEYEEPSERLLVAAIDIGTTFSGYAYSFRHDYQSDRLRITTYEWPHNNGMNMKVPSSILLDRFGEVKAFGYEAIERYDYLADTSQHKDYFFFNNFKMKLYQGSLSTDFKLDDITGKKMLAVDVFSKVIWYLKQHFLDRVGERFDSRTLLSPDDVQWVLTVPAIWDDKAKFFMRKAAEKAGIEGRHLTLALEPEAALLYCRNLPTIQPVLHASAQLHDTITPSNKYMVVDLGGGTVDITVHSVQENGTLEEIYQPTGGPWGGSTVDDEFRALLVRIFGVDVFEEFEKTYTADKIDLFQNFEIKKRCFDPEKQRTFSIKIPLSLIQHYKHRSGHDIQEILTTKFKEEITLIGDKIRVSSQAFIRLFDKSTSKIVKHIRSILEKVVGVSVLLLVGGYAESRVVRDAIISHFPNLQIIHPPESASTVMKGAVLFGHEPQAIVARVCRYTYGIAMMAPFREGVNNPRRRRVINRESFVDDIFDVHLRVGERVALSDNRTGKEYGLHSGQTHTLLEVYASSDPYPRFVTEKYCTRLGSLVLEVPPDTQEQDNIVVCLYYSGTELGVSAFNPKTNQKTKNYFDFLG